VVLSLRDAGAHLTRLYVVTIRLSTGVANIPDLSHVRTRTLCASLLLPLSHCLSDAGFVSRAATGSMSD
jgi:hypothetical protein